MGPPHVLEVCAEDVSDSVKTLASLPAASAGVVLLAVRHCPRGRLLLRFSGRPVKEAGERGLSVSGARLVEESAVLTECDRTPVGLGGIWTWLRS